MSMKCDSSHAFPLLGTGAHRASLDCELLCAVASLSWFIYSQQQPLWAQDLQGCGP